MYGEDAWTDINWKIERLGSTISDHEEEDADEVYRLIGEAHLGVIDMLLASTDIEVNIQNVHLELPLHSIRYGGIHSDTIVAKPLEKGAEPLKSNTRGQTALHLAC